MKLSNIFLGLGIAILSTAGGYFLFFSDDGNQGRVQVGEDLWVNGSAIFAQVPIDEQIQKSDLVVSGTITHISETQWNQDGGEYWEQVVVDDQLHTPIPYFTITVLQDKAISGQGASSGRSIDLTVVAFSPIDTEDPSFDLAIGDEGVFVMRRSHLAWYKKGSKLSKKPIWAVLSHPNASIYLKASDDLYRVRGKSEAMTLSQLENKVRNLRAPNN